MDHEHDAITAAKAAFDDIVDEAPMPPSWETATSQFARLTRVEPRRGRGTMLGIAAMFIVMVGSLGVYAMLADGPTVDAGAAIDYVRIEWSQEVAMVCEGMEINDNAGFDNATIEMWGPNADDLVRIDVTAPDGSSERYIVEYQDGLPTHTRIWTTSGTRMAAAPDSIYHRSECVREAAGESASFSMADTPGYPPSLVHSYLGLRILNSDGTTVDIPDSLAIGASQQPAVWRDVPVVVYSSTDTSTQADMGLTTVSSEIWLDPEALRRERSIYRTTSEILGTVNTTIDVVDRKNVNPATVSFSVEGLIPTPSNETMPTEPEETSTTTTMTMPTTTTTPVRLLSEPIDKGPLEPRGGHSVIWTGQEVIVWVGESDELGTTVYADGAAYDPATETWRPLSGSPLEGRSQHIAAWTGTEMLIIGGAGVTDGAAYRPDTDTWRSIETPPIPLSVFDDADGRIGWTWAGSELFAWNVVSDAVAAYNPQTDTWRVLPPVGQRFDSGVLRTDGETVYAFGATGEDFPVGNELSVSRLISDTWQTLPSTDFSTDGWTIGAVPLLTAWAGDRFLAWNDLGVPGTTKVFLPDESAWELSPDVPISGCEGIGEPLALSDVVVAFGWCDRDVAILDLASQTWTVAAVDGAGSARYTVWTGEELINWGDTCCYGTGEPFTMNTWRFKPER